MRIVLKIVPYILLLLFAASLCFVLNNKYQMDIQAARVHFRAESHDNTVEVVKRFEGTFQQLYQGLRTIARLPGVRTIERHAHNFNSDARGATQEIYNNLGSNVAMSEVYVAPLDLEPDRIDPATHQKQTPIITFDHLVLNAASDKKEAETSAVEQIEIYEYRLMKQQLAQMRSLCPTEKSIQGLEYPAIGGPEVITCDNSRYSVKNPDDKDRSGLVYSVPFFGVKGQLRGCISGVILTHALRDMLPSGNFVLLNDRDKYRAEPNMEGVWKSSGTWIDQGKANASLLYSEVIPISIKDTQGDWELWAAQPDSAFWGRADVRAARQFLQTGYIGTSLLTLIFLGLTAFIQYNSNTMKKKNTSLNQLLREIEVAATEVKRSTNFVVSTSDQLCISTNSLHQSSGSIENTMQEVVNAANQSAMSSQEISHANEQQAEAAAVTAAAMQRLHETVQSVSTDTAKQQEAVKEANADIQRTALAVSEMTHSAKEMAQASQSAMDVAMSGSKAVEQAVKRMAHIQEQVDSSARVITELGEQGQEIGAIIETIDRISSQTNLLALNAAIEAARAGDAGKGFAVVADEVRKLAEQTAEATHAITSLIGSVQEGVNKAVTAMQLSSTEVEEGVVRSQEAGNALEQILQSVSRVVKEVASVTRTAQQIDTLVQQTQGIVATVKEAADANQEAVQEMSIKADQVGQTIANVAAICQQTAAGAEEMSATADTVSSSSQQVFKNIQEQKNSIESVRESTEALISVATHLQAQMEMLTEQKSASSPIPEAQEIQMQKAA